jgi:anti-sigma regulatory factor (Ser/Thr protein kinase)
MVRQFCLEAGLDDERVAGVVLAVNEIATNSVRYGGGEGVLHLWSEPGALLAETRDTGSITSPLVGRELPPEDQAGGRGLWIANQICDLVQIRSSPAAGTVVRLHVLL